jgi:hypothetical protein
MLAAASLGAACVGASRLGAQPGAEPAPRVDETARFVFWSEPRVNLHHFLYQWASAELAEQAGALRQIEVPEREAIGALDEGDRSAWLEAVAFYREKLAPRSLLFDDGMVALRDALAGLRAPGRIAELEGDLAAAVGVIAKAEPVYRRFWWRQHDGANRAWISAVVPMLRQVEQDFVPRLAAAYGGDWPGGPVRVDVCAYAGRVGAYTPGVPHVNVASGDAGYRMPWAIEMLFHESSHISSLEGPLSTAIAVAFEEKGLRAPSGLDHVAIFETTGAIARRIWAQHDRRDYRPYAEAQGLYERNPLWAEYHRALEPVWREFLDGAVDRRAALLRVADALDGSP